MVGEPDLLKVVDVESVVFSRGLRGYDADEVDEFLDHVADTIQHYAELRAADQMKIRELENSIRENDELKASLQNALDMAKRTSEDFLASSHKESEAVLAQAKARAEAILADAVSQKAQLLSEIDELKRAREHFVADAKAAVLRYNMLLDGLQEKKES
ncbi:MAG: DivIVA domain-containing protein [Pyramidobacter sp.]|jgi:cell division initiation protein|nr:DivIVA domain-containing protein [Pyramidobacter sp.]MBQ8090527.1 DivIVA domain-containing protein [Pyramidobacter sp.]MBQ9422744.1 DivIVA domain-containing protein [Pyramidobacter sp.]MBR1896848.1 DivIVA domain-containing protein [Pyramidobacter sp.]